MNKYLFEKARKLYPGRKRGFQPEWDDFAKKHGRRINDICPLLTPAIEKQIAYRDRTKVWCPQWKNFKTWLYGGWWTEEIPQTRKPKAMRCFHCGKDDIVTSGFGKPPCCWRPECKIEYAKL